MTEETTTRPLVPSTFARVAPGKTKIQLIIDQRVRDAIDIMCAREDTTLTAFVTEAIINHCHVDVLQSTVERDQ
jgi:hypothetical protein